MKAQENMLRCTNVSKYRSWTTDPRHIIERLVQKLSFPVYAFFRRYSFSVICSNWNFWKSWRDDFQRSQMFGRWSHDHGRWEITPSGLSLEEKRQTIKSKVWWWWLWFWHVLELGLANHISYLERCLSIYHGLLSNKRSPNFGVVFPLIHILLRMVRYSSLRNYHNCIKLCVHIPQTL